MNKIILFLSIAAVAALLTVFLRPNTPKKPVRKLSNVAIVFAYINRPPGYTIEPGDSSFCLIDTDFRTLHSTPEMSTSQIRVTQMQKALARDLGSTATNGLDLHRLTLPNTSQELQALREQAARAWGAKKRIVLITFSAPCVAKDGRIYYYVEQVPQMSKGGWGDIYVLYKGAVQTVIPIWTA